VDTGFTSYPIPRAYNLRSDPFERADESAMPFQTSNRLLFIVPAQAVVAKWLGTLKEFPPRQKPASFRPDGPEVVTDVTRGRPIEAEGTLGRARSQSSCAPLVNKVALLTAMSLPPILVRRCLPIASSSTARSGRLPTGPDERSSAG
jgi:hypothetical protein